MSLSAPLKALAFIVFLAALAGATYGVGQMLGDGAPLLGEKSPGGQAVHALRNGTAGQAVTFAVTLHNRAEEPRTLVAALSAPGLEGRSSAVSIPADQRFTVFVTLAVPAGAQPGDVPLALAILNETGGTLRQRDNAATLRVLGAPAEGGFAEGHVAEVAYTGRLASNGRVFNTNEPVLQNLDFPKTETYRYSAGTLEVRTVPRPTVVTGFYEGMLGMQPGESRTVTFPAEKGYGNGTTEERIPRETVIERRETLDLPEAPLTTDSFAQFLEASGQGRAEDFDVGDFVNHERNGEKLRYRVVNKTDNGVTLRLHVEVGERYTIYDFWPNASEVVQVGETGAVFVTTPTVPEGQAFSYYAYWPERSAVVNMTDAEIVIRHDPPVGLQYTQAAGQFQPPRQYTVLAVDDREILVTTPSTNPLAGQALTFDITLLDLRRGA